MRDFDKDDRLVYLDPEFDRERKEDDFTSAFFPLPNPFELGDIVRRVSPTGNPDDYGVVETSSSPCTRNVTNRSGAPTTPRTGPATISS